MPSLSELPGDINRKTLAKALQRLGFFIDETGGKGSHFKATWPRTQKSVTIPISLPKQTLKYVLAEIEKCSGVTWEEIRAAL
jgi:predicted RNA binding protein YcfA (HicA-like mRNA interferase family)